MLIYFKKKHLIFENGCGIIYRLLEKWQNKTHTSFNNGGFTAGVIHYCRMISNRRSGGKFLGGKTNGSSINETVA